MLPAVEVSCESVYRVPTPVAKEKHQNYYEIVAIVQLPATLHHSRHGNAITQKDRHTL